MYERFTDRARKAMQLAHQEALRFKQEYLGTEHILLGVVEEGSGVAAHILRERGIDLLTVRREVEKIIPPGREQFYGILPQTPRTRKVIEYAIDEARKLNHNHVGTEHLLLGLLRDEDCVGGRVLMSLGLEWEAVRDEILHLQGPRPPSLVKLSRPLLKDECADSAPTQPTAAEKAPEQADQDRLQQLERRVRALEGQLWSTRLLVSVLVGALAGAVLGGPSGVFVGLFLAGVVGIFGGRLLGALVAAVPGALLGSTYLPGEYGAVAGLVLGALLGACVGDIGRASRSGCCCLKWLSRS